jgi:hypothetical protein
MMGEEKRRGKSKTEFQKRIREGRGMAMGEVQEHGQQKIKIR